MKNQIENTERMEPSIIAQIRDESTKIQTDFIMNLVHLCEEYGVDKTSFIRCTIKELYDFATRSDFDQLESK